MGDRVRLADIGQELVAEAFPFGRAFDQACDIHKGHPCRDNLLGARNRGEFIKARIRHRDFTDVRFDCAERKIGRLRCRCFGQRVEEGRLADIRQTHDSHLKAHDKHPL